MTIPAVLMSGGYHDYVTAGQIMVWDQYSSPSGAQKQMILGPFDHSTNGKPYYIFERELEFFDRYLRGNANAIDERPAVTVFIEGPNRWRYEKDWPLPDETRVKLALNPKASETVAGFKSGSLGGELAAEAEGLKIDYDPEKGPFLHALLSTTGRLKSDRAANEAENVSWTSAPLSQAVELTGRASITLSVNPEGEEADLVAQLSAVAPDGSSKQLANGYLNLARAEDASKPAKLENGSFKPYTLHLWPMAVVVPEGHALRVTLSGGASPAPDQPAPQGPGKGLKPFSVTIGQSSAQPAVVELPIIGSVPPELK